MARFGIVFTLFSFLACGSSVEILPYHDNWGGQDLVIGEEYLEIEDSNVVDAEYADNHVDTSTKMICQDIDLVVNTDYLPTALNMIISAQTEILAAQLEFPYGTGPNKIATSLKNASIPPRDVTVKVILDDEPSDNLQRVKEFANTNIQAKLDQCNKTLHSKILVVDRKWVLFGSTNWSSSAFYYNNEANLCIGIPEIASIIADYIQNIWDSPCTMFSLPQSSFNVVTLIGDGQYLELVLPTIKGAKSRIYLVMYHIVYDQGSPSYDLINAIIERKKQGVPVKIILEYSNFDDQINKNNKEAGCIFAKNGVDVLFDPKDTTTHAKLLVVDNKVVLYSGNWSKSGLKLNHETGAMIESQDIADKAVLFYEKIALKSQPISCP